MMAIKVAFPLFGRAGWTGGRNYLKNTLSLIRSRLADELEAYLLLSPEELALYGQELAPLVDERVIIHPDASSSGRGVSLAHALLTGRDSALEKVLSASGIEVAFECASFYGSRFRIPTISWITDFQHRHMPKMFHPVGWWRRELGFRMQIRSGRTIMLSSVTARDDLERFYPKARGRGYIVPFAIDLNAVSYFSRRAEVRAIYNLPEHFYFLPNQFWRHKNHGIIVAALRKLKSEQFLEEIPPVILTGQPNDPRHRGYFDSLMAEVKAAGVESHFRYLGLLPYDHVLALNAACVCMINPSLFEGWATPIEEAKALGTPLLLSDIPIHREQAPDARFFKPTSPDAVAKVLIEFARIPQASRSSIHDLAVEQERRLSDHAAKLLTAVVAGKRTHRSSSFEEDDDR